MNRPVIQIPKEKMDWFLEIFVVICLLISIIYPIAEYNHLPQTIPIHFEVSGKPDNYGTRTIIFLLPCIGVIICSGIFYLNKFPHIFNYMQEITTTNAPIAYKRAQRVIRVVNLFVSAIIMISVIEMVQAAQSESFPLSNWLLPGILICSAGLVIFSIYQGIKKD